MIDVSIIIVNFNGLDLLRNCLNSLIEYTNELNYEIIVVDNASGNSIDQICSDYKNVILLKNDTNIGFAPANNQGIKIAKGKYILLLNNDTIFIENALKKVFDFAENKKDDLIVGCKILNADRTLQESVYEFDNVFNSIGENLFLYKLLPKSKLFNKYYQNHINIDYAVEVDWVKGCFLFCSSNVMKKLGGLDERFFFFSEENDFCYRFKNIGGKIYYFPDASIIHLGGASTENIPWFNYKNKSIAKLKLFRKHFSGTKLFTLLFLHYFGIGLRVIIYFFMGILSIRKSLIFKSLYYFKLLFIHL
ncbi:MAG: glycosyltransferase family 2 protein [Clostridiales bacterium]